jgi:hypothetical protein
MRWISQDRFEESSMKKGYLSFVGLGCVVAACSNSVAPDRFSLFSDIVSLQLTAGLAQPTYSVDSSAKFNFVARNPLPRDVVVYGAGCIITLELQNMQGVTVFPSGARPCLPPLETFRVRARDSVMGSVQLSGARGNPSLIGMFALPAGTFRMRIVIQGVTDTASYNPVSVESAWSDPFDVSP